MTAALLELIKVACLAAFCVPWFYGWAALVERFAGSGCLCRKGAVNPTCPIHGWEK